MDDILSKFNKASNYFGSIAGNAEPKVLLEFYSLYKQSVEGPCQIPKPSFFDMKGRQKWESWKSLKDMPKEEAMELYIKKLSEIEPMWEETAPSNIGWVSVSRMLPEDDIDEKDKTLFHYVQENNFDKVSKFSETDLKMSDENEMTALHWACDRGYEEIVNYLIKKGLDVNGQDGDGQTPLHYAASCSHEAVVKILLNFGAKPNICDADGCLPIDITEDKLIKELLSS